MKPIFVIFILILATVAVSLNRGDPSSAVSPALLKEVQARLKSDEADLKDFFVDNRDPEPMRTAIRLWASEFKTLCKAIRQSGAEPMVLLLPSIEETWQPFSHVVNEEAYGIHVGVVELQEDFFRLDNAALFLPESPRLLTRYGHYVIATVVDRHLRKQLSVRRNGAPVPKDMIKGPLPPGLNEIWELRGETIRVKTSAQGFRRAANIGAIDPAIQRVLCLGDEATFGVGVSESSTWPNQVVELLQGADLINAGMPTGDIRSMRRYFETSGVTLGADTVLIQVQANDLLALRPAP